MITNADTQYLSPLSLVLIEKSALKLQADARKLRQDADAHHNSSISHFLRKQSWLIQARSQALLEILGGDL